MAQGMAQGHVRGRQSEEVRHTVTREEEAAAAEEAAAHAAVIAKEEIRMLKAQLAMALSKS